MKHSKLALLLFILIPLLAPFLARPVMAQTTLFYDGFENGDFGLWNAVFGNAIVVSGGGGEPVPYNGTYIAKFDTISENGDRVRVDVDTQTQLWATAYVQFDTAPSGDGDEAQFLSIGRLGSGWTMRAKIIYTGGAVRWRMYYANSESNEVTNTTISPVIDTWYKLTIFHNSTASPDRYVMWIDDSEVCNTTGTHPFTPDFVLAGAQDLEYAAAIYLDDVLVQEPEVEEPPEDEQEGILIGYFDDLDFDNRELRFATQRKQWYCQDHFYLFYGNHTSSYIELRTSSDGLSFSTPTQIRDVNVTFATWSNGTDILIATTSDDDGLYFRWGEVDAYGNLGWKAAWQLVYSDTNVKATRPNVLLDEEGYPWVCFQIWNYTLTPSNPNDYHTGWVSKSSTQDGTWTDDSGFPYELDSALPWHAWRGTLHNLNDTGVYATWYRYQIDCRGRLWNFTTDSWESAESYDPSGFAPNRFNSAVDSANNIHYISAPRGAAGEADVWYFYRNGTTGAFGGFETVDTMANEPAYRGEQICTDGLTVYMFWRNSSDIIASRNNTGGSWNSPYEFLTTRSSNIYCGMAGYYWFQDGKYSLAWVTGTGGRYRLYWLYWQWEAQEPAQFNYELYGAYDEEGVRDGAINCTFFRPAQSNIHFELDHTYPTGYTVDCISDTRMVFYFDLGYNNSRVYYVKVDTNSEEIYVFKPSQPYYTYYFTIIDFVGITNGYLESLVVMENEDRVVERWRLDVLNNIPFTFAWGNAYEMRLTCDQGTHIFGSFVAGATSSWNLMVTQQIFPVSSPTTANITVTHDRDTDGTRIVLHYEDIGDDTSSWNWLIYRWGASTPDLDVTYTYNNHNRTYNWVYADPTLDYYGVLIVQHDNLGELQWSFVFPAPYESSNPWSLDWLGTFPFASNQLLGFAIVALVFAAGNAKNSSSAIILGLIVAGFFTWLGWLNLSATWLAVTFGIGLVTVFTIYKDRQDRSPAI